MNDRVRKTSPVTQEEDGQDWNDDEPDGIGQQHGCATAKVTCPCNDSCPVRGEELLYTGLSIKAPALLSAKLRNNFAGGHLIEETGQSRRKFSTFIRYPRTDAQENSRDDQQQDQINLENGEGARATRKLRPMLNQRHKRFQQIGEQNREEEDNENASGAINKPCDEGEQRNCAEYRDSAPIEEVHLYLRCREHP